jgi:GNAT superfamily N-acetyltransferase
MNVTIRPRREEDIPALADVLVRVHELDGYPVEGVADPESWLRHANELQSWTAIESGRPIGQITLTIAQPQDETARVWRQHTNKPTVRLATPSRLFVDPNFRNSGAGRLLMETALDFAHAQELAIAFDVMRKDRAAIRLYERLGAQHLADTQHRHGEGASEPAAIYTIPERQAQTDND